LSTGTYLTGLNKEIVTRTGDPAQRSPSFLLLDRALSQGLGWDYLMRIDGGHLMPAGLAIIWALARISLYNWLLAGGVIMIGVAAASLAMLRMLVTVFARFDASSSPASARTGSLCVTRVVVGVATPDPAGQAIPSHSVHG
jgi:hypothetical protein